jgi:hypothetical protein
MGSFSKDAYTIQLEQEVDRLNAAMEKIFALQDKSFVSGERKFRDAVEIARRALNPEARRPD